MFKYTLAVILAFLALTTPNFGTEQGVDYTLIHERSNLPVISPSFAKRKTQKIRLKNGLEAYLISDPEADLNGAMLSVGVGSWEDPEQHPGLAHFLEHMLFLGTLKYPKESEYQKFITEHGGQTNAFTTNSTTSYLFTVGKTALPEALARFSSFFKEPLFNPSGVSREMQAIDQEYAQNLENDDVRRIYVLKELADQKHPLSKFSIGNSQSLKNTSRETLEEWFRNHYSANLMKLVVYGSAPLDTLRELVIEDFSGIPNRERDPFVIAYPAFPKEEQKEIIYIEPIKDIRTLTLVWELPSAFAHMTETKPEDVISTILGHEGEKSLLAQLKRENLADGLASGGIKLGNDLPVIYLQVDLTTEGLRDVDQVIARVFQAIKNLKERGVPHYLFDEIKNMATIKYQYPSKESEFLTLMKHAFQIQDEDMSTYPEHSLVIQQFDPQAIQKLLAILTPQNAEYLITAPSKYTGVRPTKKEKWLSVPYGTKRINRDHLEKWSHIASHEMIDIPQPNIFIPDDLKLVTEQKGESRRPVPTPELIADNNKSQLYFAEDETFGVPKVNWMFHILTPIITPEDPASIVQADIFVKSIKESLNKFSYPAKLAGLEFHISREDNGIKIQISGYSQNAERLLSYILDALTGYQPDPEDFKLYKDHFFRKYQNFAKDSPLKQSLEQFKSLIYETYVTEREKAKAVRKLTYEHYAKNIGSLFDQTYLKGVLFGNMKKDQAQNIARMMDQTFDNGVYPKSEHFHNKVIVLPQEKGPFYVEGTTKAKGNAVILAIENSTFSFKERAVQQILMQAIQEPFFTTLRTKQQTGYIVQSVPEEIELKLFNIFAVQSNTHDVRDLLSRFEQFIEGYLQEMGVAELDERQFENIRKSFVQKYQEPAKNIKTMGELIDTLAFEYEGDFDWIEKRLAAFKTLSYHDFLTSAKQFIGRDNKQRLAILLKGSLPGGNDFTYTRLRTFSQIRKISAYEAKSDEAVSSKTTTTENTGNNKTETHAKSRTLTSPD